MSQKEHKVSRRISRKKTKHTLGQTTSKQKEFVKNLKRGGFKDEDIKMVLKENPTLGEEDLTYGEILGEYHKKTRSILTIEEHIKIISENPLNAGVDEVKHNEEVKGLSLNLATIKKIHLEDVELVVKLKGMEDKIVDSIDDSQNLLEIYQNTMETGDALGLITKQLYLGIALNSVVEVSDMLNIKKIVEGVNNVG